MESMGVSAAPSSASEASQPPARAPSRPSSASSQRQTTAAELRCRMESMGVGAAPSSASEAPQPPARAPSRPSSASSARQTTAEELRCRMESMGVGTAPSSASEASQPPARAPSRPSSASSAAARAKLAQTAAVAAGAAAALDGQQPQPWPQRQAPEALEAPATPAAPGADELRQQFLCALARGLSTTACAADGAQGPEAPARLAGPQAAPALDADFFASVDALRARMEQRKLEQQKQAQSRPGSAAGAAERPAAPRGPSSGEPLLPPRATSPAPVPPPPAGHSPRQRPHSGAAPQTARGSQAPRPPPPPGGERRPCGEKRQPSAAPPPPSASEEDEDAALLSGSGDGLLQWADEVLRKAQALGAAAEAQRAEPGGGSGAGAAPRPPALRTPSGRTPSADARERRASELRDEMRRITEEAELECRRRLTEEGLRQRRLEEELHDSAWRHRLDAAAEEMRSRCSGISFEERAADRPAADRPRSSGFGAGCGVPTPPPGPPPGNGARQPPHSRRRLVARSASEHEAAWARLEARLERGQGPIRFADVPWPPEGAFGITGVRPGDAVAQDLVPEAEQARLMEQVKSIAQRLLDEKARGAAVHLRQSREATLRRRTPMEGRHEAGEAEAGGEGDPGRQAIAAVAENTLHPDIAEAAVKVKEIMGDAKMPLLRAHLRADAFGTPKEAASPRSPRSPRDRSPRDRSPRDRSPRDRSPAARPGEPGSPRRAASPRSFGQPAADRLAPERGAGAFAFGLAGGAASARPSTQPGGKVPTLPRAAAPLAARGPSNVTVFLATQRAKEFDPIYAATCDLVCRYASWVWEQRTSLAPCWTQARGPIASTILTLWRIGWFMYSSTVLVTDEENHVKLLTESPKDVRMHLAMGIERWQRRQTLQHYPQCDQEAKLWVRAMRRCAGGPKAAVTEGPGAMSLRVHWVGVPWTRQAQFDAKLATSSECAACGAESDTLGHRFFGCETLLEPAFLGEEKGEVLPERHNVAWTLMRDQGLNMGGGPQAWDEFAVSTCLPRVPPSVPPAERNAKVYFWGDWSDDPGTTEGNVVFTGGSGLASSMLELRRCGWAAVQVSSQGLPARAAYGPLPGPFQTVGRAERHALLQALLVLSPQRGGPAVDAVFTDLLGLAGEATSWGAALEQAGAPRSGGACARSLRALRQFQERGLHLLLLVGNVWADFFAKEGAMAHAVSQGYADFYGVETEYHKQVAAYIARALPRMLKIPSWQVTGSAVRPRKGPPRAPPVAVVRHHLVLLRGGRISTVATRGPPWSQYLRSPCGESEVAKLKADAIIEHVGATWVQASGEGSFAMAALDASQLPLDPGDLTEVDALGLGDTAVGVQGHRFRMAGPTNFCQVCVAWSGSGTPRALQEPCRGLPTGEGRDARTSLSNLRSRRRRFEAGRHLKSGDAIAWRGAAG
ncbi:unnamed protein product [Prorocentrum cordatum]|uniref:Uncharacterized protein n=1 Tax=Prorocentrum cordatum TaxID=2364126 RepID=A0ABN9V193_9DINO|nr:unnamed protein product [Polarella glacialis]